ncbi:protein kinase domain-containing protein [Thermoflavimicrobium dichotomicum]|uniref:Serine/threonine-protein kinase PrkC n=1 Tax=Thermoflavimicrobium dichotomicum TaxID=46223 RepID=A0A1I3LGE1_9BACL|nr:protein kinase [Thermoflavimicrobium dichotomicum]SFI83600.1 serine/threonine protein kinase [Thermoflavimicrobium dichotomicum]
MKGKKLGGRYEIIQLVGGGGMAEVYKARDLKKNQFVAIKILSESLSHDNEFIRRFIWEAKATAKLSHPNVVKVFNIGQENKTHYMVMEYIEGRSLKSLIKQRGFLSPHECINIAIQVCDGLSHAHQNGIIHRDIKPHNILCTHDGQYKITDFGISRLVKPQSTFTKTGMVMGSVHYISPEQARGLRVSYPSDIYSLGVVLYEMSTGRLPFDGRENIAIALQHIQEPIPDPKKINPMIPNELCQIIYKALEKDPNRRFQSAFEMKQALLQARSTIPKDPVPPYSVNKQTNSVRHPKPLSSHYSRSQESLNRQQASKPFHRPHATKPVTKSQEVLAQRYIPQTSPLSRARSQKQSSGIWEDYKNAIVALVIASIAGLILSYFLLVD